MTKNKRKPLLEMKHISKDFKAVRALNEVDMKVYPASVQGLIGENGSGKSTLMNILIGSLSQSSGDIYLNGSLLSPEDNVQDRLEQKIAMIHQELSVVDEMTLMENIFLGREVKNDLHLIDYPAMEEKSQELLDLLQVDLSPHEKMGNLSLAQKQMIEIAKALSSQAQLIIMDEPTSSLTDDEIEFLFRAIRNLKSEKGVSFIFISHKFDEIFEVCDRLTVLRDGEFIGEYDIDEIDEQSLINLMVGRELTDLYPDIQKDRKLGPKVLRVEGLSDGEHFQDVSFDLAQGEILGFYGLVGAGRTETMETLFGIRKSKEGKIYLNGEAIDIQHPSDAIQEHFAFLTEDRKDTGIFPMLSVAFNTSISSLDDYEIGPFLEMDKLDKDVQAYIDILNVKTPSADTPIGHLSGGNQQKALIAKWLLTKPDLLILDEPTRGIDIGSKQEIYQIIYELAKDGKSILLVSSEIQEVLGLCDRIVVMQEGRINAILENTEDLKQEELFSYATGVKKQKI